jgi:GTP-binding protein
VPPSLGPRASSLLKITAEFVISAASARDLPHRGLAEIALVGRSNVGKSSLINALVRQKVARTSAAPGKTRLANIYRVARGAHPPFYLVDLPGYGYARGGGESAREFAALTQAYFGQERLRPSAFEATAGRAGERRDGAREGGGNPAPVKEVDQAGLSNRQPSALLLVDTRHPGLPSDLDAWRWLRQSVEHTAIVGTKIDKLARGERIRAMRELESVFDEPVLPVSAVTGEGLEELWTLIDRLAKGQPPPRRSSSLKRRPKATAPTKPPRRPRR